MLCKKPFVPKGTVYAAPCGQCLPCRINRRRIWAHRMVLETYLHSESAFVTLTYNPEEEAKLDNHSLEPRHAQLWLKQLRAKISPKKIRYYLCGEYGERSQRPHFHAAVFGLPTCIYGRSRYEAPYNYKDCCPNCDRVRDTWGRGRVHLDQLNIVTAGYICGYVTKKMTASSDPRLAGRHPEFSRMSLRPGIGYGAIKAIAPSFDTPLIRPVLEASGDVPSSLNTAGKSQPLGRYLKEVLRSEILRSGVVLSAPGFSPRAEEFKKEVRALWADAQADSVLKVTLADALTRHFEGRRVALEARQKFSKGKQL